MPTLPLGSYVVVSRASYGYSRYSFELFQLPLAGRWPALMPRRGDVVVFLLPRDRKTHFVKRVVGLPGDRIQMVKGRLSINEQLVPVEAAGRMTDPMDKKTELRPTSRRSPTAPPTASSRAMAGRGRMTTRPCTPCPPAISSCWVTTAATPPTAARTRRAMASASFRSSS